MADSICDCSIEILVTRAGREPRTYLRLAFCSCCSVPPASQASSSSTAVWEISCCEVELVACELTVFDSCNGVSVNVLMPEQWRLRALVMCVEMKTVERWGVQLLREFFHIPTGLFFFTLSGSLVFNRRRQ